MDMVRLGRYIAGRRAEKNYTLDDLAALCGLRKQHIYRIEHALSPGVTLETVYKILRALDVKKLDLSKFDDV